MSRSWVRLWAGVLLGMLGAATLSAAPLYTNHPAFAGKSRPILVFIDSGFTPSEQEQIQGAMVEWNRALNGVARMERVESANDSRDGVRPWLVRRGAGKDGIREPGRKDQNLATVQPLPMGGGILIVFPGANDYLRDRGLTLRDVMMRELGHLAGLRHATNTELLARDYEAGDRGCVDKQMAEQVAQALAVPVEALNWCEVPAR